MSLGIDAIDLARFQFAFTVSFHIIFPAFTIGLASYLAVLGGLWLRSGDDAYLKVFNYWKTIFAVLTLLPDSGPVCKVPADLEGRDDEADEAAVFAGVQGAGGCASVGAGGDAGGCCG